MLNEFWFDLDSDRSITYTSWKSNCCLWALIQNVLVLSSCYALPIHIVLFSLRKSYEFFCFVIQYNCLLSIKHPHMQSTSVFSTRTIQVVIIDLYFWLFSLILGLFLVGLLRPYGPLYLSTLWKALRTSSSVSLETDERLPNHHTWVARVHWTFVTDIFSVLS